MPVIAMRTFDPDGQILSANNIEIQHDGNFSKTIQLDLPFYEKIGHTKFHLIMQVQSLKNSLKFSSIEESEIIQCHKSRNNFILASDKDEYNDADFVINGAVSSFVSPTVLVGIYDTFDFPVGILFWKC